MIQSRTPYHDHHLQTTMYHFSIGIIGKTADGMKNHQKCHVAILKELYKSLRISDDVGKLSPDHVIKGIMLSKKRSPRSTGTTFLKHPQKGIKIKTPQSGHFDQNSGFQLGGVAKSEKSIIFS